ncbi:50S ribosomal protein L13 [Patescibacteria group bacterium]|nr:50S ribosomal protein L13 [Patescibacteria group bacterium]MBU1931308.1 50S ribosomal protein L13 [Patescibacteria group bacterium]
MKTRATKAKEIKRHWHLIDLKDQILGRVSTQIAGLLQGKDKVYFTSNLDYGDYVVAINALNIKLTGNKAKQKVYYRHSGYPGGLREISFSQQMAKDPRKVILLAVRNMLPKNKLRSGRLRRLRVFSDAEHNYQDKFKK